MNAPAKTRGQTACWGWWRGSRGREVQQWRLQCPTRTFHLLCSDLSGKGGRSYSNNRVSYSTKKYRLLPKQVTEHNKSTANPFISLYTVVSTTAVGNICARKRPRALSLLSCINQRSNMAGRQAQYVPSIGTTPKTPAKTAILQYTITKKVVLKLGWGGW